MANIARGIMARPAALLTKLFKATGKGVFAFSTSDWDAGRSPSYTPQKFEMYVKEGYRRNEIIYACITANADTAAQVAIRVYNKSDHEELADHPLYALLDRPNPYMAQFDFWSITSVYQDLMGVAYWQKIRSKAGKIVELWPLRPDYVKTTGGGNGFIDAYWWCLPNRPPVRIDPNDVIAFKRFDPLDLRNAVSPMEAGSRAADIDNGITDYLRILQERGMQPAGVYKSKLKLTDGQVGDIIRRLRERYGGLENWGDPLVLDSDAEYQRVGMSMQEMNFDSLDFRDEARICMVFRIPPIVAGARVGLDKATYSNYEQAELSWWEDMLTPKYKHRSDVIDLQLVPEFGTDIETEFDFSQVPALQTKRNKAWDRVGKIFAAGGITRNMLYRELGMPEIDPAQGDVFVVGINTTTVPEGGEDLPQEEGTLDEEQLGKSLPSTTLPDGEKTIIGTPLPSNHATDVPAFGLTERDELFALYHRLVNAGG